METKICTKCRTELPATNEYFNKQKGNKDELTTRCKICRREINKQSYLKNKEKILEKSKKHYQEHIEEYKKWHQEHKEQKNEYKKQWRKENPEKVKEQQTKQNKKYYWKYREKRLSISKKYLNTHKDRKNKVQLNYLKSDQGKETERRRQQKKRAIQFNNGGTYTKEQWGDCLMFFNNKCAYTNKSLDNLSIDHIIPVTKNGTSYIWNLCPSDRWINSSKNNSDLEEWYRKQSYFSEERLNKIYEWIEYAKNKYVEIK